jgi:hypothetical protein
MISTGLECFRQSWNTFVQSQIVMYRVGMLSTGFECLPECWNALDRVGRPFYRVGRPLYRV